MPAETSLKDKTVKGLLWGAVNNGAQQILNLLFGIFLGRLLTPSDYGMVGMLSIFSLLASTLQESGFTAALANKKEIRHTDYNAVFWFCLLCSACIYLLLFLTAPIIASFYHTPELTPLARYCFLGFFISSIGIAHNAYLFKTLQVKKKAMIQLCSLTLSGITGVYMAFLGMAYWGIATQGLVYVSCNSILFWRFSGWKPTFSISFSPLKGMLAFSSKILITNLFQNINQNMMSVILGRFYSEKEVGYFNQANKWNSMGYSSVLGMVHGVAQPVLRNVSEDRERQRRVFRKMLRFTSLVTFPAMFGLALIAPELIIIAITDKWIASANIMQILCIGSAFLPIQNLYSNLVISKKRSDIFMWNTITLGVCQLGGIYSAYPYGIHTMILIYISINTLWLLVWQYFIWKEIRLSLISAIKDIFPFAIAAGITMYTTYLLTDFISNIYLRAGAKILLAASLYTTLMWLCRSKTFQETIFYLFKKNK